MFKKITSLLMACAFLSHTLIWAAPTETAQATSSAELTLVESIIALQGEKLSAEVAQQHYQQILAQYQSQASVDGQKERLKAALVEVGAYTPSQAETFVNDSAIEANNVTQQGYSQESVSNAVQHLAALHPTGAQFSMDGCQVL